MGQIPPVAIESQSQLHFATGWPTDILTDILDRYFATDILEKFFYFFISGRYFTIELHGRLGTEQSWMAWHQSIELFAKILVDMSSA